MPVGGGSQICRELPPRMGRASAFPVGEAEPEPRRCQTIL